MTKPWSAIGLTRCSECPSLEDEQCPRSHGQGHDRRVTVQDPRHLGIALVVAVPDPRCHLEVAAGCGRLDGQGDHEIGLVEMPLQLVPFTHHRQVEGTERISVAVERSAVEDDGDEAEKGVALVDAAQHRCPGDDVVAHGATP